MDRTILPDNCPEQFGIYQVAPVQSTIILFFHRMVHQLFNTSTFYCSICKSQYHLWKVLHFTKCGQQTNVLWFLSFRNYYYWIWLIIRYILFSEAEGYIYWHQLMYEATLSSDWMKSPVWKKLFASRTIEIILRSGNHEIICRKTDIQLKMTYCRSAVPIIAIDNMWKVQTINSE